MRAVKLLLFAVLVAVGWQLWQQREFVASAYTEERPPLALELSGVNAAIEESAPSPSPYALVRAGSDQAPTFASQPTEPEEPAVVELTGGSVALEGTVALPDGTPVSGATIRIERFTSAGSAVGETETGPDGTWEASNLQGGRLRIRAYAPNLLASVDSVVVVLSTSGTATVPLQVQAASSSIRYEAFGPLGIEIGTEATVAVVVSREAVDEVGRLVEFPLAGQPLLAAFDPPVRLLSADLVTTDAGGAARYLLVCDRAGEPVARLLLDTERASVTLPSCVTAETLAQLEAAAAAEAADAGIGGTTGGAGSEDPGAETDDESEDEQ